MSSTNSVLSFVLLLILFSSHVLSFMSFARVRFIPVLRFGRIRSNHFTISTSGGVTQLAKLLPGDIGGVRTAAEEIRDGKLVAFPTETVYGLGANAFNTEAVQAIFITKQRPNSDPLIVHVSNARMISELYDFTGAPNAANVCRILTSKFWPGPLTIIFKAQKQVPSVITAGTGFVGVRCPKHPVALALIHEANVPIAAPSANRFGHVSPTSAAHVLHDLGHAPISVLSDNVSATGGCSVGVESTVCRISPDGRTVSVLRCGAVTVAMIQGVLPGCEVVLDNERHLTHSTTHHTTNTHTTTSPTTTPTTTSISAHTTQSGDAEAPVAPGQMLKHYAPDIPTFIVRDAESYIQRNNNTASSTNTKSDTNNTATNTNTHALHSAMVIDFAGQLSPLQHLCKHYLDLSATGNTEEACFRLFDVLRSSESVDTANMGVTHVLLPDLSGRVNRIADTTVSNQTNINTRSGNTSSKDGLMSALWERLHRAASGVVL